MNNRIAAELFAGAGGMSEGLKMAGFDVKYANEINPQAALTYAFNHPDTHVDVRNIFDVAPSDIRDKCGGKITLIAGGPPCQGFSTLGKRNPKDSRNRLVWEFFRIVNEIKPKFFLMENVPGILSMNKGKFFKELVDAFSKEYHVSYRIINSADFGVPQGRRRVVLFGSVNKEKNIEKAIFRKSRRVTVKQAIGDLNFLKNGERSTKYKSPAKTAYQRRIRSGAMMLHNHEASCHSDKIIQRFSKIRQGENISSASIPKKIAIKKRTMIRLIANREAFTISTLPDDYIHYSQNRILTVREMARLQSFRDSYVFLANRTTGGPNRKGDCPQYTQVGNAVPPLMMAGVGKWNA